MNLYFYIRTQLCVSCGYKKKNTWQRARAVRQVQSFHSKHICVCWASVALGRQARQAAAAHSQSLPLPSAERTDSDSCRSKSDHTGGVFERRAMQASFPASFHADCVCVKSKCASSSGFGLSEQPGDSAAAKLSLGGLLCGGFVLVLVVCPGFPCGRVPPRDSSGMQILTLAEIPPQSGPLTAAVQRWFKANLSWLDSRLSTGRGVTWG